MLEWLPSVMSEAIISEFITSLSVGFLGGLASGVGVYVVRQKRRADKLRRAISTEIKYSTPVDAFKTAIMGIESLETPIIESNLDKLYLLNTAEIGMIAKYRNQMAKVRLYNKQNSEDGKVSISRSLAKDSSKIANQTTDLLESNIWTRPKLIAKIRKHFRDEDGKETLTEEERKKKREQLIKRGKRNKKSGKLRRKQLERMDAKDVIDEYYEK